MDYGTRSYTQETPSWLWEAWTDGGPGAQADRYCDRIVKLIAADTLANAPGQLTDQQRREAEALAAEVDFDGV